MPPSYSFRGLQNAHALGMSWKSIAMVVGGMVLLFVLVTVFMFKTSQKNTNAMQTDIDKNIQQANDVAQKQAAQVQADIQRQIDENVRKNNERNKK